MDFSLLTTEILVALIGLLVLVVGLVLPDRGKQLVGKLSLLALAIVLVYALIAFPREASYFNGIYQVDVFGNYFKILFLIAGILVMLSASKYIKRFAAKSSEFYGLMILATLGMMVLSASGDFITMYIGLELMTISFYILTAYLQSDKRSSEAGLKYLILGAISSAVLLFGMSLVYAMTGTTIISEIAGAWTMQPAMAAGLVMIIAGFAFKISVIPFHMWAPDIYQGAPIPVTTYLAVGSKAAAFAALVRVFMLAFPPGSISFNWNIILAVLAVLTMVIGNLIALTQKNVKRLLAYSSIAQAGYILVGLVAANTYGLKGVLFYAMLYVFSNTGAFAVATAVEVDAGSTDIDAFNGLAKRSPMLAAIMTVCMLSLAGIPPMAGFVGKFYLFSGAIQAGYLWVAIIGLVMSMVSVYYYLGVAKAMYIGVSIDENPIKLDVPAQMALWACLAGTLLIGIYPGPLSNFVQTAISMFL
ncbi:MAG: NADH-quinone oxidoreductase subunit N [Syntrophomonadaceae bacterium]|nr:NADH-quinone oxidoreductase subunit N [Syntrophomonadaceae bacterium]MDD4550121.1 NADH-quinone oxidoreductase subunit N [Syntrophomonadaceae bacterium]